MMGWRAASNNVEERIEDETGEKASHEETRARAEKAVAVNFMVG